MKEEAKKEAERWFLQAQEDLKDAEFNLSGKRFNVACSLAQQAGGKALKAYLYTQAVDEVWGHSLSELCEDSLKFGPEFSFIQKEASSLDKYYIPTRYSNALPGGIPSRVYHREDAKRAISEARKILDFIEKKIQK